MVGPSAWRRSHLPTVTDQITMTISLALRRIVAGMLLALAAMILAAPAVQAQDRAIINTARASWDSLGGRQTTVSNTVSFTVSLPEIQITTWTPAPEVSQTFALYSTYCASGPRQSAGVREAASVGVVASSTLSVGQSLIVRIDSPTANTSDDVIDQMTVRLDATSGDSETLVAVETAPGSGVFLGSIQTRSGEQVGLASDCLLALLPGTDVTVSALGAASQAIAVAHVTALADPFGVVFDSVTGQPVNGASVSLVDAVTGLPARVYAFDGMTPYPATVVSGTSATDSKGDISSFAPGEFRFPLVPFGNYRLVVTPPSPYSAPSQAEGSDLALLRDMAGRPFELSPASFGGSFTVEQLTPIRVDIPVDPAGGTVTITKSASREIATAGDAIVYTVTIRNVDRQRASGALTFADEAQPGLRLRPGSVRVDGVAPTGDLVAAPTGSGFSLTLRSLPAGSSYRITYAMSVREDAAAGNAANVARVTEPRGQSAQAIANVRIARDTLTERMTIMGRVVAGRCDGAEQQTGIPGVRIMLEDGSYAITDQDGRYHFEGVVPGTHVVHGARATLPPGGEFLDCARSTRSAGSAISRLVTGQGGSLHRVDFQVVLPEGVEVAARMPARRQESDNLTASGAEIDFLAMGDGADGFLFPEVGHNPRSPTVRVAVRHRGRHRVELSVGDEPVDPLTFDGTTLAADGSYGVSVWRGIPLEQANTTITARIVDRDGREVVTQTREINYATTPIRAELVGERSRLVADGASFPVLAVRLLDRHGHPVHAGISGSLVIDSPYETVSAFEARQSAELSGFGSTAASWTVTGDDGIALIDLAPTMVSGKLRARFVFSDGELSREQQVEAWIEPGDQPWTLIGLAEGSLGARTVADHMERSGDLGDLGEEARVAFYAKGQILGRYLLTLAYDSARDGADEILRGAIDPAAYYTVFADNSQRLFDAASQDRLYVRIESEAFYALYGDFETGFDDTRLGRYQRVLTGAQAHARLGDVEIAGFAAQVGSLHRRVEVQGDGTTGPYPLGTRSIVPGSETVVLEVRDRLRSELVLDRRELVRFVDYSLDLASGTIRFADPVLSRDAALNPQLIIVDFDVDQLGAPEWNGGVRATLSTSEDKVRLGLTAISDNGEFARTNLGALDARIRLGNDTEIRAEAAASDGAEGTSFAYLAQVEHVSERFDGRAYFNQVAGSFGVGQGSIAEQGHRKAGADARVRLSEEFSLSSSIWADTGLDDESRRKAGELRAAWQSPQTDAFAGIAYMADRLADGREGSSTVLQAGLTQRLLDNRLEVSGASSLPVGGAEAIDLPARHSVGLRYALSHSLRLVGSYEMARGDRIDANTARVGAEFTPWQDGRIVASFGDQQLASGSLATDASRQFAAVTLGQSVRVTEELVIDATFDINRTLGGGLSADDVLNPDYPASSGGQLGSEGLLGEDFRAFTLGGSWSRGPWSARARAELRDGELADRRGIEVAAIRRLGEGSVVGSGLTWTRSRNLAGGTLEIADASVSLAHRPEGQDLMVLGKLDYRSDEVTGAVAGAIPGAGQGALIVSGDARSRRLLASVTTNWVPHNEAGEERHEIAVMVGVRHNLDQVAGFDLGATTAIVGAEVRFGVNERFEVGGRLSARHDLSGGTTSFAFGPEVGFSPAANTLVSVGYNITGFRDPDYSAARNTDRGFYISLRVKFDDFSLERLGIGRR